MTKPLDLLMQKEMTRQEFLVTLGLGVVSIMGFGKIIELLTGHSVHRNVSQKLGYDDGTYGGAKQRAIHKSRGDIS